MEEAEAAKGKGKGPKQFTPFPGFVVRCTATPVDKSRPARTCFINFCHHTVVRRGVSFTKTLLVHAMLYGGGGGGGGEVDGRGWCRRGHLAWHTSVIVDCAVHAVVVGVVHCLEPQIQVPRDDAGVGVLDSTGKEVVEVSMRAHGA